MDDEDCGESTEATLVLCYRQRLEKSTGGEVVLMEWSPTMDVLATALANHSVILSRLSWQRVWVTLPAKTPITAMTWRPDGRVLAVGCKDGVVSLLNVEDGRVLHEFSPGSGVSSLCWSRLSEESGKVSMEGSLYREVWSDYLPPLPSVENREVVHPVDPKQLQTTDSLKSFHVLLIGDEAGKVHFCVSGIFLVANVEIEDSNGGQVILSRMSHDFKGVSMICMQSPSSITNLKLHTIDTSLVALRSHEFQHMAMEFGHVTCHLEYMNSVLNAMYEAWDDLLFKLDSQLASYSQKLPEGRTVGEEFLVLLACGRASQKLKDFLVSELTAKGVKRLGLSLEHSYDNIKKFLLHHFQGGLQGLLLHLGEVLGMARWHDCFKVLGLSEVDVQRCINEVGTVALKAQEMLHVIDHSLQSIKVFFLWLYVVILKLSNEPIPKGLKEDLTPEELKLIIDFLKKRLTKAKKGVHAFNLETVGQYLNKSDLKYVEEKSPSFLQQMMKDLELEFGSVPWLFQPSPNKSLVQLFESLHKTVDRTLATPMASINESFTSKLCSDLTTKFGGIKREQLHPLICYFTCGDTCYLCLPADGAVHTVCTEMALLRYAIHQESGEVVESCKFFIRNVEILTEKDESQNCSILSLQFYDDENLSILFQYSYKVPVDSMSADSTNNVSITHSVVAQLPIKGVISSRDYPNVRDVGPLLTQVQNLGAFKAGGLAVSGTRKVAAVVSQNGKKIRLFDVDAENETDE